MRWTGAGDKICIAYDDGTVIVGSVAGNRLWGKDLNLQLSLLQWSPDGSYILFASASGECHTYDSSGNAVARVQMFCNEGYNGETKQGVDLAAIGSWRCLRLVVFGSLQLTGEQLDRWRLSVAYSTCCQSGARSKLVSLVRTRGEGGGEFHMTLTQTWPLGRSAFGRR
jgi:hypothetical protein